MQDAAPMGARKCQNRNLTGPVKPRLAEGCDCHGGYFVPRFHRIQQGRELGPGFRQTNGFHDQLVN